MHRTLFIDIDGTLINEPPAPPSQDCIREYSLLKIMRDRAVALGVRSAGEATRQIEHLLDSRTWWDWHDFLEVLDLPAAEFWPYADQVEARSRRAIEANLDLKLEHLSRAGCRLCITSNNPSSGIRHKLRLAGLSREWQKKYIDRIFGTDVTRSMKWDRTFWIEAIKLAETKIDGITLVGNDWHDDVQVPAEVGIREFVYLKPSAAPAKTPPAGVAVHPVQDWTAAVHAILTGAGKHRVATGIGAGVEG